MTTPTPKRGGCMGRSIVTVLIIFIVACIALIAVVFVVAGPAITNIFNAVAAPITVSNNFMNALIAKDYPKAYAMVHPSQQTSFGGSAEGLQQVLSGKGWEPTSFTFTNVQVGSDAIVNGTGSFGGSSKYVYLSLRKDGDAWKVLGLQVSDDAPTATPAGS